MKVFFHTQETQVFGLPVDIHKPAAQFCQQTKINRPPIDPADIPSLSPNLSSKYAKPDIVEQPLSF